MPQPVLRPRPSPGAVPLEPGHHEIAGSLLVVPEGAAAGTPLLVFFHGAGGSGPETLPRVRAAAADAGVALLLPSSAGPTWDLLTTGLGPDVAAVDAALQAVLGRHDVGPLALGGFSDGGSYALSLGLAHGNVVPHLLAFSPGFAAPPTQVGAPSIWISHGSADTVLPVARCGRRLSRTLADAGYDVRYEEFTGGHVMPEALTAQALTWWLDG